MALFLYIATGALIISLLALLCGFRAALAVTVDSFGVYAECAITLLKFIKIRLNARVALPGGDVFIMGNRLRRKKKAKPNRELGPADIMALLRGGGVTPRSISVSGGLGVKGDVAASVMLAGGASCMLDILAAFLGFGSVRITLRPSDNGMNWLKLEGIADIAPAQIILAAAKRRRLQYSRKAANQRCTQ